MGDFVIFMFLVVEIRAKFSRIMLDYDTPLRSLGHQHFQVVWQPMEVRNGDAKKKMEVLRTKQCSMYSACHQRQELDVTAT